MRVRRGGIETMKTNQNAAYTCNGSKVANGCEGVRFKH
jgi:hypothetical protein